MPVIASRMDCVVVLGVKKTSPHECKDGTLLLPYAEFALIKLHHVIARTPRTEAGAAPTAVSKE